VQHLIDKIYEKVMTIQFESHNSFVNFQNFIYNIAVKLDLPRIQ
jgi:hypothetical protein